LNAIKYAARRERIGSLDCVVVGPEANGDSPVTPISQVGIFCHGFGASGDDLVGLAGELLHNADASRGCMLVFPAATLSLEPQGMPDGRAWWLLSIQRLISAMEDGRYEQIRQEVPEGIDDARTKLTEVIEIVLERCGLSSAQLLLGGFSQGAMLAVETALRGLAEPPAKLCLYSGALICEALWKPLATRLSNTHIVQSHGRFDPILPLQTGLWLREMLQGAGCQVDWIEFNGPHTIPQMALDRTAQLLWQ
jgi:phospholipase/carboxylesterase